ncbi:MAG: hypothetical protein FWE16_02910 [Firmicutes bacterium]|nr:hypothetical protein [Bacillota bacterium]
MSYEDEEEDAVTSEYGEDDDDQMYFDDPFLRDSSHEAYAMGGDPKHGQDKDAQVGEHHSNEKAPGETEDMQSEETKTPHIDDALAKPQSDAAGEKNGKQRANTTSKDIIKLITPTNLRQWWFASKKGMLRADPSLTAHRLKITAAFKFFTAKSLKFSFGISSIPLMAVPFVESSGFLLQGDPFGAVLNSACEPLGSIMGTRALMQLFIIKYYKLLKPFQMEVVRKSAMKVAGKSA